MNKHQQKLPKKTKIFRAWIVDHYSGTIREVSGGPWVGSEHAQDAIEEYFKKYPPQTVTDYDIGGYVEEVELDLLFNPKE